MRARPAAGVHVSLERIAINCDDARIPDNAGNAPVDEPVVPGAPAAYFSTLPVKAALAALGAAGIPAEVSQTAGTYVCNHVFYGLMHALRLTPGCGAALSTSRTGRTRSRREADWPRCRWSRWRRRSPSSSGPRWRRRRTSSSPRAPPTSAQTRRTQVARPGAAELSRAAPRRRPTSARDAGAARLDGQRLGRRDALHLGQRDGRGGPGCWVTERVLPSRAPASEAKCSAVPRASFHAASRAAASTAAGSAKPSSSPLRRTSSPPAATAAAMSAGGRPPGRGAGHSACWRPGSRRRAARGPPAS